MDGSTGSGSLASRLFEQHGAAIQRYFHRHVYQRDAADDLCQEVFLKVVRAARRYEPRERDRAWIFRIARNVLTDHIRRGRTTAEASLPMEAAHAPTQVVCVELNSALARLPVTERDAFLLAEVAGLTYAEIANLTDETVPAVRSRIYRARLALRDMLVPPAPNAEGARILREDHD